VEVVETCLEMSTSEVGCVESGWGAITIREKTLVYWEIILGRLVICHKKSPERDPLQLKRLRKDNTL
jgi:hypothetical protein